MIATARPAVTTFRLRQPIRSRNPPLPLETPADPTTLAAFGVALARLGRRRRR
ncbi:hypothetical protein EON77_08375 [bacterium]|nr:MAG: hypothetical protein EON77_08375 [bacterium]